MHAMREDSTKGESDLLRRMLEGPQAKEDQEGDPEGDAERGVKATIPEGEHPFDYLFEGHQQLMAGCLLLEEIDSPLEEEELEEIKKLLDPYGTCQRQWDTLRD